MKSSVGVIGVGAMGGAMVQCLLKSGYRVSVLDIVADRMQALVAQGARGANSLQDIASQSEIIFVVVVDADQIDGLLQGADGTGLLAHLTPNHTVFFNSTISPEDAQRFCEAVQQRKAGAVDAPISGGPARAASGTMSMMLAAPAAMLEPHGDILDNLTAKRFVISGRYGDAAKAKLANNLMAGLNLLAGAEALAFGERLGLDPRQLLDLMSASSGQSWMADDRLTRALANDYEPRAQTKVLTKDVRLANELATRQGLTLPLGGRAAALYEQACAAGYDLEDDAAVLKHYRQLFNHILG